MSDDQDYRTDPSAIQSFEDSDITLKISVAVACVAIISVPIYLVLRGILSSLRKQLRDRKVEPEPYETRSVKSKTPTAAPVRPKTSPPPPPPCLPPPPPPVPCTEEAHVPITFVTQPQPRQPQEKEEAHVPIKFVAKPQPREEEEEAHVPIEFATKPQPEETPKEVILPIQYKVKGNEAPSRSLQLQQQQQPSLSKESPPQPYETQVQPTQSAPVVYKQPQQEPQASLRLPSQNLEPVVPQVAMTGPRPAPTEAMKEVPQQPPYQQTAYKVNSEYLSMRIQPDPAPTTKYESKTVITATSPTAPRSEQKRQRLQLEPVILEPVRIQTTKAGGGSQTTVPVSVPVPRSDEPNQTQREAVPVPEPSRVQARKAGGGYQSALSPLKSEPSKYQSETIRNQVQGAEEGYQTTPVPISRSKANKTQLEPVRTQAQGADGGSQSAVVDTRSEQNQIQPEQRPKLATIQSQKTGRGLEGFKAPVPTPRSEPNKIPSTQPETEPARIQTRKAEGGSQPPLSSPRSGPNNVLTEPVQIQAQEAVVGSQPAVLAPKSKPSKAQPEQEPESAPIQSQETFKAPVLTQRSELNKLPSTQPETEPVRIQTRKAEGGYQPSHSSPRSEPNKIQPEPVRFQARGAEEGYQTTPVPISRSEANKTQLEPVRTQARGADRGSKSPVRDTRSKKNQIQPEQGPKLATIQSQKNDGGLEGFEDPVSTPRSEPHNLSSTLPETERARIQLRKAEGGYQPSYSSPRSEPIQFQPEPVAEPEPVRIQARKADGSYQPNQPVPSPRPEPDKAQSEVEPASNPTRKIEGSQQGAVPKPRAVPNQTQPEVVPESESVKTLRESKDDGSYQTLVSAPVISTPNNKRQSRLEPEPLRILTRGEGGLPIQSKTIKKLELPAESPLIPIPFIMSESKTTQQSRTVTHQPTTYERPMTAAANNLPDTKIKSVKTQSKKATTRIPIIIEPKELSKLPTKQIPMTSSVSMKQDRSKSASPPTITPTKQWASLSTPSRAETATGSLIIPSKPKLGPTTTQIERTTPASSLPYSALVSDTSYLRLRTSEDPLDEEEADYFPVVKASNVHTQPTRLSRAQLEPKRVYNLPTKQKPASLVVFLEKDQGQDNSGRISSQSPQTKQLTSSPSPAPVKSIPRVGTTPSSPGPGAGRKQFIPSSSQQQQQPKHYQFNASPRDNQQTRDRDRDRDSVRTGNADKLRRVSNSPKNSNNDKMGFVKKREYDGSEPPIIVVARKRHSEDEDGEMMKGKPRMTQCEIFTSKDFPPNHGRRSSGSSGEREQQQKCSLDPPAPAHDDRNTRSSGSCPVRRSIEKDAGCENKNRCKRTGTGPGYEGGLGK